MNGFFFTDLVLFCICLYYPVILVIWSGRLCFDDVTVVVVLPIVEDIARASAYTTKLSNVPLAIVDQSCHEHNVAKMGSVLMRLNVFVITYPKKM